MVKYIHCEKCKDIYNTEPWIGEVHIYNGICSSCSVENQQENHIPKESEEHLTDTQFDTEPVEVNRISLESPRSSPSEIDKNLLSNLTQKAHDVLSSQGSIDVLIKEIKDDLVDKARERIEGTFQSFDAGKIDAQKVVDSVENMLYYLSEYRDYMDKVIKRIQDKPKMKIKTAIDKVFKESTSNISKEVAKDTFLNKKNMIKIVYGKALKWYDIYSKTEDTLELTKKMVLHPFNEIQKKLSILPFYSSK
jgi:hypothetical protein